MQLLTLSVTKIKEGDRFIDDDARLCWTATGVAEPFGDDGGAIVPVQYPDGGRSERFWVIDRELTIERAR